MPYNPRQETGGYRSSGGSSSPADAIKNAQTRANVGGNTLSFPGDAAPVHMNIIQAEFKSALTPYALTSLGMYRLPVPLQMTDQNKTAYNDGFSYLGETLNIARTAAQGFGAVGTGASNFVSAGFQTAALAGKAGGFAVNTIRGVTLEQPQFKSHQLSWKLSPKSREESITIQRIIHKLKTGAAIRYASNGKQKAVFSYPNLFIPYFYPNTAMMYKFKPCVISSLDIDFNGGNGGAAFYAGSNAPESITIQMTLIELEFWTAHDYEKDTAGDDTGSSGVPTDDPFKPWAWYGLDGTDNGGRDPIAAAGDAGYQAGKDFLDAAVPAGKDILNFITGG